MPRPWRQAAHARQFGGGAGVFGDGGDNQQPARWATTMNVRERETVGKRFLCAIAFVVLQVGE
jgi:hypothetical protein